MTRPFTGIQRGLGWTACAAGLAALVAGLALVIRSGGTPPDAGAVPVAVTRSSASPSAPAPIALSPVPPALRTPTRLTIAALGVAAPVDPAGVGGDGALGVPDDPRRVGWWIGSARPGADRGTVLVAGHVDTAQTGKGALYGLERLPIGAVVDVWAGDRAVAYHVVARRSFDKHRLPADLFADGGRPRLVLMTCGGRFSNGAYSSNVVVYAVPGP